MSRLDSQVAVVQRKLAVGTFIEWLAVAGFVLGATALLAILSQKLLYIGVPAKWLWPGVAGAVIVAGILAIIRWPSRIYAAEVIDERLGLKEKFSTALSVRQMADPFAQAVVLDAEQTADRVSLSGKFPLAFPRLGYGVILVTALALVATLLPNIDVLGRRERQQAQVEQERKIGQSRELIKQTIAKVEALPVALRSNEQIRIAKFELEQMLNHPMPDPQAAARRAMDQMQKVDEALKKQMADSKAFAQAQKNASMFSSMQPPLEGSGPVAQAQREIVKGNFKEAAEKLKDTIKNFDKMSEAEKKQAMQQMQQLAQQLQQMAQNNQAEQKMAEQMKQLGVNQEQIKKAQDLVQQAAMGDKQAQQQLQQMQQQMQQQANNGQGMNQQQQQQLQKAMQQAMQAANAQMQAGQMAQAAQAMAQAMQQAQAGQMGGQGQAGAQAMQDMLNQLEAMQQDAAQMAAAQAALAEAMANAAGQCNGQGQGQGDKVAWGGKGNWQPGDINRQGRGQGGAGIGMGGRGDKTPAPFGTKQEISRSYYDPKGQHLASTLVKDRSIRGEAKLEIQKIAEAAQASEGDDVDDSGADRRSQEVKRRYFNVMAEEAK